MRNKTTKIIGAVAIVAALAGSGAAFTASNTIPASVAGYGSSTISGATATQLNYTLAADGATITDAALVFTGDQTGRTIKAAFGTDPLTACTIGSYDGVGDTTPVTCGGYSQSTAGASSFKVAVSQ
jgi:hypothetical protein